MPVAPHITEAMASSSFIRRMFEEGILLKSRFGADQVYDFSIGNPDLEPPEKVARMLKEMGTSPQKGCHGYMPNAGYPETRSAMAAKVSAEQGVDLDHSRIVMGVGAAGAMNAVLKAVLSPGGEVLVSAPFFPEYAHYARNHGGNLRTVPSKEDFSLDVGAIEAAISSRTAALIINSPNNPTGKIYTRTDIEGLAAALKRSKERTGRSVILIADEPYREVVYDGREVAPVFPSWPDSVIVSSFAKNLSLPGERIGYAAVNPASPDAQGLTDAIIFCTRVLGFVNAPATFQRIVAQCWNEKVDYSSYLKRRNLLTGILDEAGIEYSLPEGAFYLFCRVPERQATSGDSGNDGAFCEHLKGKRILAVPGKGFGKPGWFRLAYCVSEKSITLSREAFKSARMEW